MKINNLFIIKLLLNNINKIKIKLIIKFKIINLKEYKYYFKIIIK